MTVTEFVTLEVLLPYDSRSSAIQDFFRKVAELQSATSGYPMRFFQDANASTLYILAGWPDAAAHQKWIESEGNGALVAEMQSKVAVKGLVHLDIDFNAIPADAAHIRLTTYPKESIPKLEESGAGEDGEPMWRGIGATLESSGSDINCLQAWTHEETGREALKTAKASGATLDIHMIRLPL